MRSCGGSAVMSSPKKWIRPAVGGKSPVMALKSVVLPAPLEPRIAAFSPAATDNDTSSTARSAPKTRVTPARTSASPDSSELPCFGAGPKAARAPLSRARGRSDVIDAIALFFFLLLAAVGNVARAEAHLLEVRFRQAERLRDVRHRLDDLVVERAVRRLRHFRDVGRADAVAVAVDLHFAGRALEVGLLQRVAVRLLATRQVTLHRIERFERGPGVDVVQVGEQRRAREAVLELGLVVGDELLPLGRVDRIGHRPGRRGTEQRLAPLALV